jgi:hypothetical protein
MSKMSNTQAGRRWPTPVILATWEAEIRFKGNPGQRVRETLSLKTFHKNRAGGVTQGVGPEFKEQTRTDVTVFGSARTCRPASHVSLSSNTEPHPHPDNVSFDTSVTTTGLLVLFRTLGTVHIKMHRAPGGPHPWSSKPDSPCTDGVQHCRGGATHLNLPIRRKWENISPPGTYSMTMYKFVLSCGRQRRSRPSSLSPGPQLKALMALWAGVET